MQMSNIIASQNLLFDLAERQAERNGLKHDPRAVITMAAQHHFKLMQFPVKACDCFSLDFEACQPITDQFNETECTVRVDVFRNNRHAQATLIEGHEFHPDDAGHGTTTWQNGSGRSYTPDKLCDFAFDLLRKHATRPQNTTTKSAKLQQQFTTQLPMPTPSAIGYGYSLGNESPHNFAVLAEEFLTAAKVLNVHGNNWPCGPTYFLIFQALELQLKSFLRGKGVPLKDLSQKIGHSIQTAIAESEKRGLDLGLDPKFRQSLMEFSEAHRRRDHLYRSTRKGPIFRPSDLIDLVDKVRSDCKRVN